MTPEIVEVPHIKIIGFSRRTNNAQEMSGNGQIGQLWQDFMRDGGTAGPNELDQRGTFCTYDNFESDHNGAYDVTLGKPVGNPREKRAGMRCVAIPAGKYMVFPAASATPEGIISAWKAVYAFFATSPAAESGVQRAFTVDFEHYAAHGIFLYISVR